VEKVVLNGVLTQSELRGDPAIRKAFRDQFCNLPFAPRKRKFGFIRQDRRRYAREGLEDRPDLLATRPRLAFVHALDAPTERSKGIIPAEDSLRSCAKSIDDPAPVRRV